MTSPVQTPSYTPRQAPTATRRDVAAVAIIVAMLAVLAVRLHELLTWSYVFRPALTVSVGGLAILLHRSERGTLARLLKDPAAFLLILYFGWACLGVPFALWRGGAFSKLQLLYPAILLVLAILICPRSWENFDRVLSGYTVAVAAFALALVTKGRIVEGFRMEISFTHDANDAAAMFAMVFPIAVALATRKGPLLRRILCLGSALICLYGLVRTGSRGGTIAVIVAGLVLVMGQQGSRRIGLLLAGVVFAIGAWSLGPPEFRDRLSAFAAGEQDYNYTDYGGRVAIWGRALRYWGENPVIGVGIGSFPVAEGFNLLNRGFTRGVKLSNTHNAYLQAAAELGTVGLGLFLAMLFSGARRAARFWVARGPLAVRNRIHRPELLASMMAFMTSAVFLSHAYYYPLFAMLGLISLATQIRASELVEPAWSGHVPPAPRPSMARGGLRGPVPVGLRVPGQGPADTPGGVLLGVGQSPGGPPAV